MNIISYFPGIDPAAALIRDGHVVAYVEEERLIRYKHAPNVFPVRSIQSCLDIGGISLADVDCFVYGWDAPRYGGGDMARFYDEVNKRWPPNEGTRRWQQRNIGMFTPSALRHQLEAALVPAFGVRPEEIAPLEYYPHHRTHAACAFFLSAIAPQTRSHRRAA